MLSILGREKKKDGDNGLLPQKLLHISAEYKTCGIYNHLPKVSALRACYLATVSERHLGNNKSFQPKSNTSRVPTTGFSITAEIQTGVHLPLDLQSPRQWQGCLYLKHSEGTKHRKLHIPKDKINNKNLVDTCTLCSQIWYGRTSEKALQRNVKAFSLFQARDLAEIQRNINTHKLALSLIQLWYC